LWGERGRRVFDPSVLRICDWTTDNIISGQSTATTIPNVLLLVYFQLESKRVWKRKERGDRYFFHSDLM